LPEILGKTDRDFFPSELADKYIADDQRVMQSCQNVDTIEEHRRPDGSKLFVHVVKTPIYNAQVEVVGVQGIFWDVTQEVLANQAVANSEKRYRQLTEATMDGIVVIDPDGSIVLFNPAAERMFGYVAAEILGAPASLLVPEELKDFHDEGIARFLKSRLPDLLGQPREFKGRRKDGSDFPAEIALSLLADPGDGDAGTQRPAQILAAIRDLTERNKMRALMVQNEKLASIGLLSAGVAHEINNPLAFVANNLVVMERDCKGLLDLLRLHESGQASLDSNLAEEIQTLAQDIDLDYIKGNLPRILSRTRDGIERVTRIVHSLRGMARTEAPRRQVARIPDLVDGCLEILHGKFKRLGVVVAQEHDPNPVVPCVPSQISQVILNLVVNAYQAIEATGQQQGRIDIRTARKGEEILLEIHDNGGGIKQEHLSLLFDPFFTTKDVGEGTGLGLSISHHIVSAHGGRIEVETQPGDGSRFKIYLPLKDRP
jgi:PAS domain S-box-containing protein